MKKLTIYLSLALILWTLILPANNINAETTSNIIYINSVEDLIALSTNCTLDTYSQNKIISLTTNIDLSDIEFKAIPSFSGLFNGNNYTISGFKNYISGSSQGLFRYLQEDGVIQNLNVEAEIKPKGTKKQIGGIIGTNRGQIINCSFKGTVKGDTSIGGVVGYNDKTGSVTNCTSNGIVIGEHYTGGIVGQNVGYIQGCINNSQVNTNDDSIPNNNMASYDIKSINKKLNSTENIDAQTDTGGIVGYNRGIIESSVNKAVIGYQHVGYNIGGVVGRQSGYISKCKNYGVVYGRKDVGGIVGQSEPFIRLLFSEDTLEQIDNKLVELNTLVEKLVNEKQSSTNTISSRLESLNTLTNSASNKMQALIDNTTDYIDESTGTVNTGIERFRHVMDQLEPVVDSFTEASEEITKGITELGKGFDELSKASSSVSGGISDLDDAFDDLERASNSVTAAFNRMSAAMDLLRKASEHSPEVDAAIEELIGTEGADGTLQGGALQDLMKANEALEDAINKVNETLEGTDDPSTLELLEVLKDISPELKVALENINSALPKITHALSVFAKEFQKDQPLINQALINMTDAMENLRDFSIYFGKACEDMNDSLNDFNSASYYTTKAMKNFSNGTKYFTNASNKCTEGLDSIRDIIKEYNEYEMLQLPKLTDYITESSDSLFEEIDNISEELTLLNNEVKDSSNTFYNNLRNINKKFEEIADIIRDGLNSLSFNDMDLFEDISDKDYQEEEKATIKKGVVNACYNEANIFGDVNVGGITGSMAIEYDFDPEDDILNKGKQSFNFKYQTKALLLSSVNKGNIEAKKNYAGGIVGRMDLGLIITSENYGSITNLDGDYTGGIAGSSKSVIRQCYSLSELSGKDYVGGIAGYGTDIYNCHSLINVIESNEYTGAIAGDINGIIENNIFVENSVQGVDGISYGNKAIPRTYDEFIARENLPKAFKSLELNFIVDNNIIKTIPFKYGDSISVTKLPEIPNKQGHYSEWSSYDLTNLRFSKNIEAIYTPMIQVLSSDYNSKHPKLLVEGSFEPANTLHINEIKPTNNTIDNSPIHEIWSVELDAPLDKSFTYRLLNPDIKNGVSLYQKKDSKWKKLKTTIDGSYLLFETNSKIFELAVVANKGNTVVYYILGVLLLLIAIIIIIKKKKKLSRKKKRI
ncbi:MAG: hypothetical protein N4A50_07710 [Vallitalea sp.]|nr:hypothetical protein [Vallitalea sp.]